MRRYYCLLFILLTFSVLKISAQTQYSVRGSVQDTAGFGLPGALVKIISGADSLATSVDVNGNFTFNNVKFSAFVLKAAFMGFESQSRQIKNEKIDKVLIIPAIKLKERSNTLNEVVISGAPPVRVKEDTIQFAASAFKVREGDAVEEVIKKLPGVSVDKDGKVTTQGKPITKIRVNGKDFFGTDVATAIQNLPAEIVQNLQIIDDYGDQAKLTGIKSGEPEKILNINIQPDKKKGYFARGVGGVGNESRYVASARGNIFKGERQISFDATMNNTNLRGGAVNGLNNNRSAGLNYKGNWGKKFSADGGYSFNNRDNATITSSFSQGVFKGYTRLVNSDNTNRTTSNSHNVWGNLEFRLDSSNYFKLSPNFNWNASNNVVKGGNTTVVESLLTARESRASGNSSSLNTGINIFYNHKFQKPGRNISLFTTLNFSEGNTDRDSRNDYVNDSIGVKTFIKQYQLTNSLNDNFRTGANFTYSEPITNTFYLDLNYNWNFSETKSSRILNDIDPKTDSVFFNPDQSNNYSYQFTTHRAGLSIRKIHQKYNYSFGLNAQPTLLRGEDIRRHISTDKPTFNLIPAARFVYRFSKQESLTANYNGRSNQPGFTQLQPIRDSTNRQNIIIGNPELEPEFTQGLNVEYNKSDWKAGNIIFASVSTSETQNRIVTSRRKVPNSTNQVTSYLNTDGFYSVNANYSIGKSLSERKYTITYTGGGNFNNNIAFSDSVKYTGKNLILEQGLRFRLDSKNIVDAELSANYSINTTRYSLEDMARRNTNRLVLGVNGRNYFFKDLTLGYELNKTINRGYTGGGIANPSILNLFAEYRFLKKNAGTLRLNGVDLLNQNTGIQRDVFDNEIVDSQTNRLGRYFLLSFILRMRKFG